MMSAETTTEVDWQKLDGVDPKSEKSPMRAKVDGEGILIFRTKNGLRGVQRSCPHMAATLMDADLVSNDTMIRCKQHVYTFRLSDGQGVNCLGFAIKVYEVKEEGGALYARPTR
jgi:nitrite reductase/ring-hydroxylating ferredoxin subunit